MTKRFDERVLHLLLDKYERSLLYTGDNRRNQVISIAVNKRNFPEYFEESSLQYDVIHQQLLEQESKGFIMLYWKNNKVGHILEKCTLIPEKAEQVYALLKRKQRSEKEKQIIQICNERLGRGEILDRFLSWLLDQLVSSRSVKRFCDIDDIESLQKLCSTVLAIEGNKTDIFLREFSIRLFHDSKEAEKRIQQAVSVIKEFSQGEDFSTLSHEEILEEYSIYKNPNWIYLKGQGEFRLAGAEALISINSLHEGIALGSTDIERIAWNRDNAPKYIITIENLTSFHRWKEEGTLAIYLGGYHNRMKCSFLKRLYEAFGDSVTYYHFGDIDVGGFKIWKHLCQKTNIPFFTFHMDIETFDKYQKYGRELTSNDKRELSSMQQDYFYVNQVSLFQKMLDENTKLEQECIF